MSETVRTVTQETRTLAANITGRAPFGRAQGSEPAPDAGRKHKGHGSAGAKHVIQNEIPARHA